MTHCAALATETGIRPDPAPAIARRHGGARFCARAIVVATLLASGSGAEIGAQIPPRQVLEAAVNEIDRYSRYTIFDFVSVSYDAGVLTLSGKVTMPFKRTDIERRVERIEGVERVVNRIEVLPVSQFDEDLRRGIARAIYGNSSFWEYAAMTNPPIHVIVEGGRVTLAGVVRSEVEKHLARSLVTSFGAFSITNELITEAEWRRSLQRRR